MGNLTSSCCSQATSRALDELCDLTTSNYNRPYELSFQPEGFPCCSTYSHLKNSQINGLGNLMETEVKNEGEGMVGQPMKAQESSSVNLEVRECYSEFMTPLQKNQNLGKRNLKSKTIKKAQKPRKPRTMLDGDQQPLMMNPQEGENFEKSTTVVEDGIRDQNNCKSYHKLVKNYLMSKGLAHLFDEYEVQYHTRYYFIVALIFIKYYLKQDFNEAYTQIVQQELEAQRRKIDRREKMKVKVEKDLTQRNQKDVMKKKNALEMKINHIRVVIHEIEDYSLRSCKAFFSGNTEEALRILYLKDDPVMRKKYYFDSALEVVCQIQNKVRKATSHLT